MTTRHDHITTGRRGEDLACGHLLRDGMRILQRNWRHPLGELDIIARLGHTLVFCEVKTRRSIRFGTPMSAITPLKVQRIKRLAGCWGVPEWVTTRRFDVIGILLAADQVVIDHRPGVL